MLNTMIKTQGRGPKPRTFLCCLHTESGRTGIISSCIHGYQCRHCAFDQWLDEVQDCMLAGKDKRISEDFLTEAS
jgi:hypothetical protein